MQRRKYSLFCCKICGVMIRNGAASLHGSTGLPIMQCKTADELMALAKAEGFEITKDEAEAYFAELADVELDEKALRNIAGGTCTLDSTSCWTLSN